jgi:hypothetical protein
MANANFSLGQVNITDYLIVQFRKVSNPTVIADSQVFPPPQPTTRNISFVGLDPTTYYVDFRESVDGISLGLLLASYVYDVKNQQIVAEFRYYVVDGSGPNDPASGQDTLSDPYLDGKTIQTVYKEGFRPLVPPPYIFKEFDLVAGGGIQLLNGQLFSSAEIVVIWISYVTSAAVTNNAVVFAGVKTITADTLLDPTYYGNRIKCHGAGSRLVVTFPPLASIPDNTLFYFTTNKGTQIQTKFVPNPGDLFEYSGDDLPEISLGTGEHLWICKSATRLEVIHGHPNIQQVGQRFPGSWKDHINALPEDGRLIDGDDYPRPWYWVKNKLPATHYIVDDNVINGGYTHPAGKEGLFVIHSTLKKMRLPNSQNWSERGLKNFTAYGTDADRPYDYPGGSQAEMIGPHNHEVPVDATQDTGTGAIVGGTPIAPDATVFTDNNSGTENRVKNIGVIYLRRI